MADILTTLLESRTIWLSNDDGYLGRASDGTVVTLGNAGDEERLLRYLRDHPTPKDW